MSFAKDMRVMSNINCSLASLVNYGQERMMGIDPRRAYFNYKGNIFNGHWRNDIAYCMQSMGNPTGNAINMMAGYGNPISNAFGTCALLSICNPWMFFNGLPFLYNPYNPMMALGSEFLPFGGDISISFKQTSYHYPGSYLC